MLKRTLRTPNYLQPANAGVFYLTAGNTSAFAAYIAL